MMMHGLANPKQWFLFILLGTFTEQQVLGFTQ
jgi:hypothetical protein